jgi:DNA-binding HxlR family transcriptional regulator
VLQLASGPLRLGQLRKRLPGISAGVLDRHLQQMVALGLLARRRFRELPPRVEYELTDSARELLPIVGTLTRWGARHLWSAPRLHEQVDVSDLLSLLPTLLEDTALPAGIVELTVQHPERTVRHMFDIHNGCLQPVEPAAIAPWACISGSPKAWIAALEPAHKHSRLQISGDEQLAERILDALAL